MPVRKDGPRAGLAAVASRKAPAPSSPPSAAPFAEDDADRPVKFTAVLDQHTVTLFERVTFAMRRVGRLAGGRYPSRADVLRAVVALVDDDPDLADRVAERIRHDLNARAQR